MKARRQTVIDFRRTIKLTSRERTEISLLLANRFGGTWTVSKQGAEGRDVTVEHVAAEEVVKVLNTFFDRPSWWTVIFSKLKSWLSDAHFSDV